MKKADVKLLEGIAKKMGKENFIRFVKTNELPAVKLTKKEMAFLQGGSLISRADSWIDRHMTSFLHGVFGGYS